MSNKNINRKTKNQYLDFLIDPSFQGVNILFVLSFENEAQRTTYKGYYLPTREIKNYNVMTDGQNVGRSQRNCFRFFTWNCKSILILFFASI